MESFLVIAVFSGIIVCVISVLVLIEKYWCNRRREAILPRATQLGFTELPSANFDIKKNYSPFLVLRSAHLINDFVIHRGLDREKQQHVFDIELHSGRGQCEKMTLCVIRLPNLNLPKFMIKGRDKIRFTMRFLHDINRSIQTLLSHYRPIGLAFSKKFQRHYKVLTPEDRHGLQGVFNPELIQLFENHIGWQVEGMGDWLLFYRRGILVRPSLFEKFVTECQELAEGFYKTANQY